MVMITWSMLGGQTNKSKLKFWQWLPGLSKILRSLSKEGAQLLKLSRAASVDISGEYHKSSNLALSTEWIAT